MEEHRNIRANFCYMLIINLLKKVIWICCINMDKSVRF